MSMVRSISSQREVVSPATLQMLAAALKQANRMRAADKADPKSFLAARYPEGLFSDAEQEALAGIFKP